MGEKRGLPATTPLQSSLPTGIIGAGCTHSSRDLFTYPSIRCGLCKARPFPYVVRPLRCPLSHTFLLLLMEAATFCGNGVLAARLNDFIAENLDDAAAVASLSDNDLTNVNGRALNESELVRLAVRSACARTHTQCGTRWPRSSGAPAGRRVFCPARRCAPARRRHARASCVPPRRAARPYGARATRPPWPASFEARGPRPSARAQEAFHLRALLYAVRPQLIEKGDLFEDTWGTLAALKAQATSNWCALGPTLALRSALTLSPQGEREDALAQQPEPVAGRHQRPAPAAEPRDRACGVSAGGHQGASAQLRRCGTRSFDSPLPQHVDDGDDGGHAAKAPKVRDVGELGARLASDALNASAAPAQEGPQRAETASQRVPRFPRPAPASQADRQPHSSDEGAQQAGCKHLSRARRHARSCS